MHVGHINLSETFSGAGEHFADLIESLQEQAIEQYVLVRNTALAKRLDLLDEVTVGPVVRSSITACCLMPPVDVVHIHDRSSRSAGLLLTLTRSVPFVLTRHETQTAHRSPIDRAAFKRASGLVEKDQTDAGEHVRLYGLAVDSLRIPTMML